MTFANNVWFTAANPEQLNSLVNSGIVEAYPPLCDKKGSYTAQFEHVSVPPRNACGLRSAANNV